jgi:hypothetical protein
VFFAIAIEDQKSSSQRHRDREKSEEKKFVLKKLADLMHVSVFLSGLSLCFLCVSVPLC